MLRFNPSNSLNFTPNSDSKLETSFIISNPSNNCSAPFKIKSTKPELFIVRPHIGVILPLQQVQVTIVTSQSNNKDLAKEIAHEHKFKIEYAMLDTAPFNINEAIQKINDENKQVHKLYLNTPTAKGQKNEDYLDSKSNLTNRYKSVRDENEDIGLDRYGPDRGNYSEMSHQERFEYLKEEIDKLEKERSEIIMASKPKKNMNLLTVVLILVLMIVVGNIGGKLIGSQFKTAKPQRKQRQYRYLGLQKLWAGEEAHQQQEQSWYKFWK